MSENQQVALVTGASRGIGHAILSRLVRDGYTVIGTATSDSGAQKISDEIKSLDGQGEGLALNVTDKEQILDVISVICDKYQAPGILVNNAGITSDNLLLRMDEDEWSSVIDTNLSGVFRLSKACLKSMFRARFGRIVNIGSVVGSSGNPGQANYAAAKAGLVGLSKSLAQEVAGRGVTVNVVSPGFIATDMTDGLPETVKSELLKRIPMKRLGTPEDIADVVSFLVSDGAKYITGETIHVNGGMYMS